MIAIEKDRRLTTELPGKRETENVEVIEGDALKIDWHRLIAPTFRVPRFSFPGFKVVGNIPYYITSPLIDKALTPPLPERIVFLVQAEVADRIAANPGGKTYGALSVGVQALCRVEKLFTVAPGAFRPPPKVRSAVVRLIPLATPLIRNEEAAPFRAYVTACFSKRRKQLKNAIPGINDADLEALGLDPTTRPERLAPETFVQLLRRRRQ